MERVFLLAVSTILAGDGLKRPGEVFQASAEIADELLALGSAREAEAEEIPAGEGEEVSPLALLPPLDPARLAAIEAVLPQLDADAFTAAGTPKVLVLRVRTGFIPTAEETAQFKRPA